MTARRAIKVLAYFWVVLATMLLAVDILVIVAGQPVEWDTRGVRILVVAVGWLFAVLVAAACLSEIRASPRSHAPVWWLVVVMAAYGYWRVAKPGGDWIGGGAVWLTAMAVLVLDIIELFRPARP